MTSFNLLPPELYGEIDKYLPLDDRRNLKSTSRHSLKLATEQLLRVTINEDDKQNLSTRITGLIPRLTVRVMIDITEREKRWFEMEIVGLPAITKFEKYNFAVWKFWDSSFKIHLLALCFFFIAIAGLEALGVSLLGQSCIATITAGVLFYPQFITGNLRNKIHLYTDFRNATRTMKDTYPLQVIIPSELSGQKDKVVYIVKTKLDENKKFSYITLSKDVFRDLNMFHV